MVKNFIIYYRLVIYELAKRGNSEIIFPLRDSINFSAGGVKPAVWSLLSGLSYTGDHYRKSQREWKEFNRQDAKRTMGISDETPSNRFVYAKVTMLHQFDVASWRFKKLLHQQFPPAIQPGMRSLHNPTSGFSLRRGSDFLGLFTSLLDLAVAGWSITIESSVDASSLEPCVFAPVTTRDRGIPLPSYSRPDHADRSSNWNADSYPPFSTFCG